MRQTNENSFIEIIISFVKNIKKSHKNKKEKIFLSLSLRDYCIRIGKIFRKCIYLIQKFVKIIMKFVKIKRW